MKKILTIIVILTAVMLTSSCQKELPDAVKKIEVNQGGQDKNPEVVPTPELKVSEPGQFGPKGGELIITVTSTAAWSISKGSGSDWLTVKPESGNSGSTSVTLVATENKARESRTATLTVKSGEITKTVEVSQSANNPEFSMDTNNLEFTSVSGSKSFTITSNISWTVSSSQAWCSVSPSSGSSSGSVTVKVDENTSTAERTAMITLKSEVGDFTVKVIQGGAAAVLSLNTNSLEFASDSGSKSFNINSNISWTVSSDQVWCSISPASGNNDGSVTVKVDKNASTAVRTATVTVKSDAGNKVISVTQSGAAAVLTLDANLMEFTSGSGSKMFRINSNTSWAVSSNMNWCSVNPTSGSGDGSVAVSVEENTSTSERKAVITVESETITRTFSVTQAGAVITPEPTPQATDRTFTVRGVKFRMIYVEGGSFTMGATSEQGSEAKDREKPAHAVRLSSYSIGETEVTQALWMAVMGSNPSYFRGDNKPVEQVTWYDCHEFISKLNIITGENFRLPTEAEWEFAARGGNKSRGYKYAGSNILDNVGWYYNNIPSRLKDSAGYGTQNVGTKLPNELGLYDMSGNVWEWCNDWYGSYSLSTQTNPTGPSSGENRVGRGGDWYNEAGSSRITYRPFQLPTFSYFNLGLRLAL